MFITQGSNVVTHRSTSWAGTADGKWCFHEASLYYKLLQNFTSHVKKFGPAVIFIKIKKLAS